MRREKIPPYLTTVLGKKRCSACGLVFPKDSKPSLSKAFAEHVRSVHKPKKNGGLIKKRSPRLYRFDCRGRLRAIFGLSAIQFAASADEIYATLHSILHARRMAGFDFLFHRDHSRPFSHHTEPGPNRTRC